MLESRKLLAANPVITEFMASNGNTLSARESRARLRSKAHRNAHLIDSTEEFIEKIASRSATTGRPYLVRCGGVSPTEAGAWFEARLAERRERFGGEVRLAS